MSAMGAKIRIEAMIVRAVWFCSSLYHSITMAVGCISCSRPAARSLSDIWKCRLMTRFIYKYLSDRLDRKSRDCAHGVDTIHLIGNDIFVVGLWP